METKKVKMHVGCGGILEDGICNKCGKKTAGFIIRVLREPLITKDKGPDRSAHRRRIREGRDIFK